MTTQPTLFATNDRTWREPGEPHNRDRCDETVRFEFGPWALMKRNGIAYRLTIELGRSGDRWTWGVAIYTPEGGLGYAALPKWGKWASTRGAAYRAALDEIGNLDPRWRQAISREIIQASTHPEALA